MLDGSQNLLKIFSRIMHSNKSLEIDIKDNQERSESNSKQNLEKRLQN